MTQAFPYRFLDAKCKACGFQRVVRLFPNQSLSELTCDRCGKKRLREVGEKPLITNRMMVIIPLIIAIIVLAAMIVIIILR